MRGRGAAVRLVGSIAGALAALLAGGAGPAGALPVLGGRVIVDVTSEGALLELGGVQVGAAGTAREDESGRLVLPIAGGDVDPSDATGSLDLGDAVLRLESSAGRVDLRAMALDLTFGLVTGGLRWAPLEGPVVELAGIPLFLARSCFASAGSDPCLDGEGEIVREGIGLDWAGAVVQVLADAFFGGEPALRERDPFGIAQALPELAVPEPGAVSLVLLALAGALARRLARR